MKTLSEAEDNTTKLVKKDAAKIDAEKKVLSLREAAAILDVSVDTLRRAIKQGSLKAFQINKSGNWKIRTEEIDRFIKGDK